MAKKTIVVSDLSGQDIPDDEQVELRILELEGLSQPVKLDASRAEADRLRIEAKPMALIELVMPDGTVERVAIDAAQFKKSIKGDADEVMASAEALSFAGASPVQPEVPRRRGRRPRDEGTAASSRADKVNYTDPDKFGQLHRGRLTDEEITLVKENPEQASRNREAQGHPPIDWQDSKEKARYNLTDDDVVRMVATEARSISG